MAPPRQLLPACALLCALALAAQLPRAAAGADGGAAGELKHARRLAQAPALPGAAAQAPGALPGAAPPPAAQYPTWAEGIAAANSTPANLTTLMAAVEAAGVASALNATTRWTVFAPTNAAFARRLQEDLAMTPAQLLAPANRPTLVRVLMYHVVPAGAFTSAQLTNNQSLATALDGAQPLVVERQPGKKIHIVGATNKATVLGGAVLVNGSVIHVVNDLLLPAGIGRGSGKRNRDQGAAATPAAAAP